MADADTAPVTRAVLRQAIAWKLRCESGDDSGDAADLQAWLSRDPEHARAWRQLAGIDARMRGGAQTPQAREALRASLAQAPQRRRGAALPALVATCVLGACAWLADQYVPVRHLLAGHLTRTGEMRSLTLADGSRLLLDTRTALDVDFGGGQRRVVLRAGRVLVETGHEDGRPFLVETPDGTLRALGTRFSAAYEGDGTTLVVLRSAVAARPAERPDEQVIGEGRQVIMHRDRLEGGQDAGSAADAWAGGMQVVEDARLGDVLATLGRYHPGRIELQAGLEDLRVSGSFPLARTEQAAATLAQTLGLTLRRRTGLWLSLSR